MALQKNFKSFFNHIPQESESRPPHSKEFKKEWRRVNWDGRDQMEADLKEFKICHPEISHLRILLHGSVGAGKSSFINSANRVFQHRVMTRAGVASGSSTSHTKGYKSYKIRDGKNNTLPFVFNDLMGLQDKGTLGIQSDDIINAMMGHVREKHVFNPVCPLKDGDPGYISFPTLNEKAHCLVSVLSASTLFGMYEAVIRDLQGVRAKASNLGIPQVLILTHVDQCCPLVRQNLRKVYISKTIKEKMENCSNLLGIPMTCIFPVKNYHEESDTSNDIDVLLLSALRQIVNFADDYVDDLVM